MNTKGSHSQNQYNPECSRLFVVVRFVLAGFILAELQLVFIKQLTDQMLRFVLGKSEAFAQFRFTEATFVFDKRRKKLIFVDHDSKNNG